MEALMTLFILAVLIQAIVEGVKNALTKWDYLSIALAALLCPLAGIDAFAVLGVPLKVPYVGAVLTGAVVGRGAAAVYDIWERIRNWGEPAA